MRKIMIFIHKKDGEFLFKPSFLGVITIFCANLKKIIHNFKK